jgi:hypothetical protein
MVDNTIALQVRPFQMPDVGQIYGQAQTLQANRMRMEEAQETARERNALRGLMASGVDLNTPEGLNQLRRAAPMLAPQFEQAAGQRAYQTAQAARLRAQTQADQIKTARDLLSGVSNQAQWDAWRRSTVAALPEYADAIPTQFSPQNVQRVAEGADGIIRRATEAATAGRPNEFERALLGAGIRPGSPEWQDAMRGRATSLTGGRAPREQAFIGPDGRPLIVNLDTGVFRLAQETPMGAAPATAPPVDLRRPQAAAPAAPAPANMMLPNVAAPTLAAGPGAVPAAAAPTTFEQAQAARSEREVRTAGATAGSQEAARLEARSDAARGEELGRLQSVIPELRAMTAPGGLLTEATGGGINALIDRIGALFNYASPGAQATGRLEPIAGEILRTVPRFEGPQSNADVALYQKMAGDLANPELPNATRLAAAREIQRLMEKRLQQIQTGDVAAPAPSPAPPPARGAQPVRTGQRNTQAAPTLEQFLVRARQAPQNSGVSDEQLTAYYNRTYGGR